MQDKTKYKMIMVKILFVMSMNGKGIPHLANTIIILFFNHFYVPNNKH